MWEFLQEANNWLVGAFGVGISGLLIKAIQAFVKLYKEKQQENARNNEAFKLVINNDSKQDDRLDKLEKSRDFSDKRAQGLIQAQKASLHNQLWNKSEVYLKRGWIDVGELSNFEIMYHAYKDIGGNHTGDTLHDKVKDLPVKDTGILREGEI